MSYVGNIAAGGTTHLVGSTLYGTCATAANVAAKAVTCANFDQLITGVEIRVKFTYSNTAANPTLNVNNTGAKSIYRYGTTAPGTTAATSWQAGAVASFTYDGTNWIMTGWLNDNTTYSAATQSAAGLMSAADKTALDALSSRMLLVKEPVFLYQPLAYALIEDPNSTIPASLLGTDFSSLGDPYRYDIGNFGNRGNNNTWCVGLNYCEGSNTSGSSVTKTGWSGPISVIKELAAAGYTKLAISLSVGNALSSSGNARGSNSSYYGNTTHNIYLTTSKSTTTGNRLATLVSDASPRETLSVSACIDIQNVTTDVYIYISAKLTCLNTSFSTSGISTPYIGTGSLTFSGLTFI